MMVRALLILLFAFALPLTAQSQRNVRTRTLEGIVIDRHVGAKWDGIIVESKGGKYTFPTGGDLGGREPKIIGGNIYLNGTRVRVTYRNWGRPRSDGSYLAEAIVIIKLNDPSVPNRNSRSVLPSYIRISHREPLRRWLANRPDLRLATDKDCNCVDQLKYLRRSRGSEPYVHRHIGEYHPYYLIQDFNGDGSQDFAVILIDTMKSKNSSAVLAIFNGSASIEANPAFFRAGLNLFGSNLFYLPSRSGKYRLLIGPFESSASSLEPRGRGYVMID